MAARQIHEHNIPELESCFRKSAADHNKSVLTSIVDTTHPEFGSYRISTIGFPEMQVLDVDWGIPESLSIHESNPSETVDINFVLEGKIGGDFRGLGVEFELLGGTNNMKYTPSEKSTHHAGRQNAKMFTIALEKNYFRSLVGCDSSWAAGIQQKMERGENFFASKKFIGTTPHMKALIHGIRHMQPTPMSRMMTQAMIFELLAHQIDQLANNSEKSTDNNLSTGETEKLHHVRLYIEQHFLEDLNLTDLCRESMLNEFKLKKGFKRLFGTSVIRYAQRLRMEFARTLLRDHRVTIEEVSRQLGYRYPNHFSVAFKKHFGVVPSER